MVMNGTHGEQRRDRHRRGCQGCGPAIGIHTIGEHQNLGTVIHSSLSRLAQGIKYGFESAGAGFNSHLGGEVLHRQTLLADPVEFGLIEHRGVQMDHRGGFRLRLQCRTAFSQMHLETHHQLFPQGINRRVGDLSETLLEIVVEKMRLVGEHCQWDVISHAEGGLLPECGHVSDDQIEILCGETHGGLQSQQVEFSNLLGLGPRLWTHIAAVLLQPVAIGKAFCGVFLHQPVVQELTGLQIHRQHLPRAKSTFLNNGLAAEVHDAGLGAHDHETVLRGAPASRAETVAVKRCTNTLAIGEHQQCRAIPWFLDSSIEFVHRRDIRTAVEIRLITERLGHEGDQAVSD